MNAYQTLGTDGLVRSIKNNDYSFEFKYYEVDEKGRMVIKKLYLDPFLDMFNGEILSYGISKTPSATSVLSAQKKAIEITSDSPSLFRYGYSSRTFIPHPLHRSVL